MSATSDSKKKKAYDDFVRIFKNKDSTVDDKIKSLDSVQKVSKPTDEQYQRTVFMYVGDANAKLNSVAVNKMMSVKKSGAKIVVDNDQIRKAVGNAVGFEIRNLANPTRDIRVLARNNLFVIGGLYGKFVRDELLKAYKNNAAARVGAILVLESIGKKSNDNEVIELLVDTASNESENVVTRQHAISAIEKIATNNNQVAISLLDKLKTTLKNKELRALAISAHGILTGTIKPMPIQQSVGLQFVNAVASDNRCLAVSLRTHM